jgi:hypothetical protein
MLRLSKIEVPIGNAYVTEFNRIRSEFLVRTDGLIREDQLTTLDVSVLSSLLRELDLILAAIAGIENVTPKLPSLPPSQTLEEVLDAIQTTFFR